MTPQEMLAKARRDYPVGTKFISPCIPNRTREITKEDYGLYDSDISVIMTGNSCYICYKGQWGEIIYSPKPKELPIFN